MVIRCYHGLKVHGSRLPILDPSTSVIYLRVFEDSWPGDILDDDIEIMIRKEADMKGAVLIEGFPSVGMVSTIVSNYLIKVLDLEYIGYISSRYLYPTAVINNSVPMAPLRIYFGKPKCKEGNICEKVVVVTSEFPPPNELMKPLVDKMIEWTHEQGIRQIISVEGILNSKPNSEGDGSTYGISSTAVTREKIKDLPDLIQLENGIITGISGVLLYEAERLQRDVICILADAHPDYPDARAAARLIESLDHFLPDIKLDTQPLIDEAELLESQLKKAMAQAKPAIPSHPVMSDSSHMYG